MGRKDPGHGGEPGGEDDENGEPGGEDDEDGEPGGEVDEEEKREEEEVAFASRTTLQKFRGRSFSQLL